MRKSPKGPNEQAGMVARRTRVLFYGALGGGTGNGAADGFFRGKQELPARVEDGRDIRANVRNDELKRFLPADLRFKYELLFIVFTAMERSAHTISPFIGRRGRRIW